MLVYATLRASTRSSAGLKVLVYEALRYYCMRPQGTSLCDLTGFEPQQLRVELRKERSRKSTKIVYIELNLYTAN